MGNEISHDEHLAKLPIAEYCARVWKMTEKPFADIGCGDGKVAKDMTTCINSTLNTSFDWSKLFIQIDPFEEYKAAFKYYDSFLETKTPHNLFIHWSFPVDSVYDIEALCKGNPEYAIVVVEMSGVAGGYQLLHFLTSLGLKGFSSLFTDERNKKYERLNDKYELVSHTQQQVCNGTHQWDQYVYTVVLLKNRLFKND